MALANHLYNRAPKDGTEIRTVQNGLPFERLFHMLSPGGNARAVRRHEIRLARQHDADRVRDGDLAYLRRPRRCRTRWREETILGASGTSADSYVLAMLSNNLLGTKFKVVVGYAGATEVLLAVENGEVEGEAGKDWTTLTSTKPQWIRDKQINILVQMGMRANPDIKGVPMAIELARRRRRTAGSWRSCSPSSACRGRSSRRPACRRSGSRCCAAPSMRR